MFALNIFVQWFNLNDNLADQFDGLVHNVVGAFTVSVLAPLLEEAMFRGAMQGYMMRRFNPWVGIVVAALVFGLFHMNPVQIMYATLLGIVFGWIYYRTRSLMSVIVGHVLNNSMATAVMLLFPASEMEQVSAVQPASVELGFEVMTFMGFVALSLLLAIKLHRMLPPVSRQWSDACDKI
jgi:membrane protease YdiL (CAAX protease family)